jgi:hypothetical protein
MNRKLILGTIAAAALAASAGVAQAVPAVVAAGPNGVVISAGPPDPVYEVRPADRNGYDWVAGHYAWRNGRYAWVPGYWVAERPGYIWEDAHWVRRGDGTWVMVGGGWERRGPYGDRDGDGIPNRYDRDRDGDGIPNRYDNAGRYGDMDGDGIANGDDDDRDGDGVANWNDAYPNNRYRS